MGQHYTFVRHHWWWCVVVVGSTACSTTFEPQTCALDKDCGDGQVCEMRQSAAVCVPSSDAPIVIGMSAPVSGTNQALGTGMKLGIELAFADQNANGGIRGRELKLEFRDDAYQPDLAEAAARALVDVQTLTTAPRCPTTTTPAVAGQLPISTTGLGRGPNAVLAFIGNVGTPTMVRAAPVAIETGTVFFGPFTGATTILRDSLPGPCKSYIFNMRASYAVDPTTTTHHHQ